MITGPVPAAVPAAGRHDDPPPGPPMRAALAPVRAAMLRRAREEAARIVQQARAGAAETLAQAHAEAAASVGRAAQAGRTQAEPLAAALRSRGRRDVRSTLLGAQCQAYDELRAQVHNAVRALPGEPGYGALLERLSATARRAAGPDAELTPDPAGGVIARAPGIVVDCSLPRLADDAVVALGAQVESLWAPGRRPARSRPARSRRSPGPAGPP